MKPKIEEFLTKSMTTLGHAVESVIGHAKKAKGTVKTKHGIEPILAIEGHLPMPKIKELISVSINRIVKPLIPNLVDKSSLEVGEGEMKFCSLMKEKGSAVSIHVDIGGSAGRYEEEATSAGIYNLRAASKSLPFEDGFFDFIVANLATSYQGDIVKVVKEMGRLITLGGHALIIDFHPFGRFAKRGSVRLRSMESIVRGVEDYYKIGKAAGFDINYIREGFIDETLRPLFETPEEKSSFRLVKETPFLIFLMVTKKGR